MKIGVCILATNIYLLLGLRFIHKWRKYYKGDSEITFYLFTDRDPSRYIETNDIKYIHSENDTWVDGTNSKFKNIIKLEGTKEDYLFYFDADTNISKEFDEKWFIGDMVGGQHFADQSWMKERKGFERYVNSTAYVPLDTDLPEMYYYGAFFGGTKNNMINFCQKLRQYQQQDKLIDFEPGVNDESYINKEFHYNPPTKVVLCKNFAFDISDKGGLGETRNLQLDYTQHLQDIEKNRNKPFDIINNEIFF